MARSRVGRVALCLFFGSFFVVTSRTDGSFAAAPELFPDVASYRTWGKDLFLLYCASCHGKNAQGDGPVAPALNLRPPDLTEIKRRYDGKFPRMTVVGVIDGETPLAAHGMREMPVWGRVFRPERRGSNLGSPEIYAIVDYLESIQKKTAREIGQ
jgi:mono/diheme cytochrome c family protein